MCVTNEIKQFLEKNGIKQSYVADGPSEARPPGLQPSCCEPARAAESRLGGCGAKLGAR